MPMQIGFIRRQTEDSSLSRSHILYNNPNHKLFIDGGLLGLLSVLKRRPVHQPVSGGP